MDLVMRFSPEEQLPRLEAASRHADPDQAQWQAWLEETGRYAGAFLEHTRNGPAWEGGDPEPGPETFGLNDGPSDLTSLLEECRRWIDHRGLNPASGGHLGYIPGGGLPPAALGDLLAAITNRYAGIAFANPGAVALEHFLVRWMADLFGFPAGAGGTLTSGGSIANLVAITTARDASGLPPSTWERIAVYGSPHMHHCLHKALRIAGLGHGILREVPLDPLSRMNPDLLASMIRSDRKQGLIPLMILASAGTTDTGAVDPLNALADIATEEKMWFHVDAAYGGFFQMVPECEPLLAGLERADSLVVDPHKGLFLPYGIGAVLLRDVRLLYASHYYQANYMQDAQQAATGYSPADLSPELTRHFRGLRMYFALKMTGLDAIRALLWEKLLLARLFHHQVEALGFETGPEPMLSVTVFRYRPIGRDPDPANLWLAKAIREDGRVFLSSTLLDGQVWIRLAVLSFRTHREHIEKALSLLEALRPALAEQFGSWKA
jgi:aromatic-L-amino-acid/L-tryptophan decarboxylase